MSRPPRRALGALRPRYGGPLLAVIIDLFRDTLLRRSWTALVVVILTVGAIVLGSASQAAIPFFVYSGL